VYAQTQTGDQSADEKGPHVEVDDCEVRDGIVHKHSLFPGVQRELD